MLKFRNNVSTKVADGKVKIISSAQPVRQPLLAKASGFKETANFGGGGARNSVSMSSIGGSQRNNMDLYLMGLLDDSQEALLNKYYRDIYYYDPIAGSAVDLQSSLPFSDFALVGGTPEQLSVYNSSIERLNFKLMNRFISANFLVYGSFTGTTVYDRTQKIFTDLLPYEIEDCQFQYNPFASMDPMITVTPNKELQEFLTSEEPVVKGLRGQLPKSLIDVMSKGDFVLDPLTTLFLARRGMDANKPVSYYKRILPLYLLEKTLLK